MENQHRAIKGYRELEQWEIDAMNTIKELANEVKHIIDQLYENELVDHRWVSIGATDLQKGFMAITRAVAQPESF